MSEPFSVAQDESSSDNGEGRNASKYGCATALVLFFGSILATVFHGQRYDSFNNFINAVGYLSLAVGLFSIAAVANVSKAGRIKRTKAEANDRVQRLVAAFPGWSSWAWVDESILAISKEGDQFAVGRLGDPATYPISSLATVEVIKDGASVIQTKRGSQALGAAVGELLLGSTGAVIGGLSGSRTTATRLFSVALKIVVDDDAKPVHSVTFFRSADQKTGADARDPNIKPHIDRAERFHALLANAMRRHAPTTKDANLPSAVADHLSKLWELRQAGALTDKEFAGEKAKVLGADHG